MLATARLSCNSSSTNLVLVAVISCATVRRHCDCFIASLAPFINPDLLTYLLTSFFGELQNDGLIYGRGTPVQYS